jgi:hypothetical protein
MLAGRDHGAKDFFRRRFDPGPPLHGQVRRILRQVQAKDFLALEHEDALADANRLVVLIPENVDVLPFDGEDIHNRRWQDRVLRPNHPGQAKQEAQQVHRQSFFHHVISLCHAVIE